MSKWLQVKNLSGEGAERTTEIWIDGVIGYKDWMDGSGTVSSEFIQMIGALGDLSNIHVFINSPGGVVSDGVTITNYLINHAASISVTVMGQAASIASVIAQAADPGKLHMALGSTMFVHDPLTGVIGNAKDMRHTADMLDKIRDSIITIYKRRTDLNTVEIMQLLDDETTMTAEDAVAFGFADSMDAQLKAVACHNLQHAMSDAREAAKSFFKPFDKVEHNPPEDSDMDPKAINAEYISANHSELVTAFREEGAITGKAEGATAERERIQAVFAQSMPGHEALVETLAFDGKTTGPEAAVQILNAERSNKTNAGANIAADAAALNVVDASVDAGTGSADDVTAGMSFDQKCEHEFNSSEALQKEFKVLNTYKAFKKNEKKAA